MAAGRLPALCGPGDTVAIGGPGPLGQFSRTYERFGGHVVRLSESVGDAEVIVLDSPTQEELSACEHALRAGGTIVLRGNLPSDASLVAPSCVLLEVRLDFEGGHAD
jgi:hypothetical protein